jgi:hypothetical protein
MSYAAFNPSVPAGTQNGTAAIGSANANDCALRDAIISGCMTDFKYSSTVGTGTAESPQYQSWRNQNGVGTTVLRATNAYSGNYSTQTIWEISYASGAVGTWNQIITEGRTYDASGNLVATNNSGSIMSWLHQWLGKFKALRDTYATHEAKTPASSGSVHGLGTLALQAASAVAITGGSLNGVSVGAGSPATDGVFRRVSERYYDYPTAGSVTLDWSYGGSRLSASGWYTVQGFNNVAYSPSPTPPTASLATHALYCTNLNTTTFPSSVNWGPSGKPTLATPTLVQLVTLDGGGSVMATVVWGT